MHTDDDVMAINTEEWDLVARLLEAMSPREDGPYPGAQLYAVPGQSDLDHHRRHHDGGRWMRWLDPRAGRTGVDDHESGVVRGGDRRGGRAVLQGHHRRSSR